jgi:hypothetical protein
MASWAIRVGWDVILSFGPSKILTKNNEKTTRRGPRRPQHDNFTRSNKTKIHMCDGEDDEDEEEI